MAGEHESGHRWDQVSSLWVRAGCRNRSSAASLPVTSPATTPAVAIHSPSPVNALSSKRLYLLACSRGPL